MSAELRAWAQGNEWQFVKASINSLPSFPHSKDQLHYLLMVDLLEYLQVIPKLVSDFQV